MDATIALSLIEGFLILLAIATNKALRFLSCSLHVVHQISCKGEDASFSTVSSSDHIVVGDPPPATKYEVFLSFRGEDTRNNFASYLYEAFCKANIQTFMDHKLHKGDDISPILLRTIEESEVSVIIFSQDYASSTWCLDELVHILECKKKFGRVVVPIFYKIDPSNVSKQSGSFGDGFAKLKQRFKDNPKKLHKWENALIQSTSLSSGWDSKNIRPESKLIKEIVKDILSKLNYGTSSSSCHVEGLVGINHKIEKIEELLMDARIVGMWGIGGIGKTTLAKAMFHKLKSQFEASSFVGNVREQLARTTVENIQEECLKELLKDQGLHIYNMRSTFVKRRLQCKKILLILDDVDNLLAAEDLTKLCDWFGEGSRIIVTSRDMQVLKNASATTTYHVKELEFHDALNLFSLKAFKQNEPFKNYLELSRRVVSYCRGNPLALIVLGCFLYGRTKQVWESALEKLEQAPHKDIFNVLKLSFDGLDEMQEKIFLDLIFFLKGVALGVSRDCLRSVYGSSAHIDISVLKERSLILVNEKGDIEMHALLMDMGLEISRQQFISNPEKPIRLWRHQDIYHFFNNVKARIEAVRCVSLDVSKMKMIKWRSNDFRKMLNLIFFRVYKSDRRKPLKLNLFGDLDYIPEEVRLFSWEEYPLPYVPLHFCAENLVILRMLHSNVRQLGNGTQHFPNLKEMNLGYSKDLTAVPDLCHTPKIEVMSLGGCVSLAQIHCSSNVSGRNVTLYLQDSGQLEMDIEGIFRMKGLSPIGFDIVRSYNSDGCDNLSMKLAVGGKLISGVGFKHGEENAELRHRLECLLPYVKRVEWSETAIDDVNQHYNYHLHYTDPFYSIVRDYDFTLESEVQAMATATTATSMEYYDSKNSVTLTRYHSSITPEELLNLRKPFNENIPPDLFLKAITNSRENHCKVSAKKNIY